MGSNWLKQRREELHLSQEALAARLQVAGLDVTRAAISHWETERDNAPLTDITARRALAEALQLTISEMLFLAGYDAYEEEHSYSDLARRAAVIIDKLPPAAQKAALEQLRILERLVATTH